MPTVAIINSTVRSCSSCISVRAVGLSSLTVPIDDDVAVVADDVVVDVVDVVADDDDVVCGVLGLNTIDMITNAIEYRNEYTCSVCLQPIDTTRWAFNWDMIRVPTPLPAPHSP